ncbi:hypothetical protein NQ318_007618 [Aromia moschata]|uniref:Uncharacterized protein n=1 Tax=Aromia moschata TaxID=1265417 RepID=A0AAV8X1A1_9CUCU|nr:hypothetical protein NQ318_007618 [Aromia moschata]
MSVQRDYDYAVAFVGLLLLLGKKKRKSDKSGVKNGYYRHEYVTSKRLGDDAVEVGLGVGEVTNIGLKVVDECYNNHSGIVEYSQSTVNSREMSDC